MKMLSKGFEVGISEGMGIGFSWFLGSYDVIICRVNSARHPIIMTHSTNHSALNLQYHMLSPQIQASEAPKKDEGDRSPL